MAPLPQGPRGDSVLTITFYGVRGSTPCASPELARYGGNTSCVAVRTAGGEHIILDLGTGLRYFGDDVEGSFVGTALVTHLHWDHVQGLPFFAPINRSGAVLDIHGPVSEGASLAECFAQFMRPPYFPVCFDDLAGEVRFHDTVDRRFTVGDATVTAAPVPHVGATNGYRIDCGDVSMAYVSDHQEPIGRPDHVDDRVLELCAGVDVLIHDAQYTADELAERHDWGHCTVAYAVEVARQAGAGTLVLFHHDPSHDDATVDELAAQARTGGSGVARVVAAHEGLELVVGGTGADH